MERITYSSMDLENNEIKLQDMGLRIQELARKFSTIQNSIDINIQNRDNIHNQLNITHGKIMKLEDCICRTGKIINGAMMSYSNCEKELNNILSELFNFSKDKTESMNSEMKVNSDFKDKELNLFRWIRKIIKKLDSPTKSIKQFF